jgi:hypothetical protein
METKGRLTKSAGPTKPWRQIAELEKKLDQECGNCGEIPLPKANMQDDFVYKVRDREIGALFLTRLSAPGSSRGHDRFYDTGDLLNGCC